MGLPRALTLQQCALILPYRYRASQHYLAVTMNAANLTLSFISTAAAKMPRCRHHQLRDADWCLFGPGQGQRLPRAIIRVQIGEDSALLLVDGLITFITLKDVRPESSHFLCLTVVTGIAHEDVASVK